MQNMCKGFFHQSKVASKRRNSRRNDIDLGSACEKTDDFGYTHTHTHTINSFIFYYIPMANIVLIITFALFSCPHFLKMKSENAIYVFAMLLFFIFHFAVSLLFACWLLVPICPNGCECRQHIEISSIIDSFD